LPLLRVIGEKDAQAGTILQVARPGARHKILVVDDNRDAADSLCEMLRLYGHELLKAYDGTHAIRDAKLFRPDVVLLDIGLPGWHLTKPIDAAQLQAILDELSPLA
jgi:PleD family two-component response regulator